jgi:hypothetical protein
MDFSQMSAFLDRFERAARGGFKRDAELFLEGLGHEFLRILEDEIIRRNVRDSRLLLNSFHKGDANNVWEMNEGGLTLEVGTNLEYASYVNDGHWTNTRGVKLRWIPGRWEGDRFIHDPSADTGMALKQHWVEGARYFENALRILEQMYPGLLETKLQQWLDEYFGG